MNKNKTSQKFVQGSSQIRKHSFGNHLSQNWHLTQTSFGSSRSKRGIFLTF